MSYALNLGVFDTDFKDNFPSNAKINLVFGIQTGG